jgi:hypothetical protein
MSAYSCSKKKLKIQNQNLQSGILKIKNYQMKTGK